MNPLVPSTQNAKITATAYVTTSVLISFIVHLYRVILLYYFVLIHCVQNKTPTHIFFHISMNDL